MASFAIEPDTPFSLAASASFGFGPNTGRPEPDGAQMRLAFVADDMRHHAGVHLTQRDDQVIEASVQGDAQVAAVQRQVERILCLDHPGREWLAVGSRDPVIGSLQSEHAGLRPVLFHSPYEAAAWAIIATRRQRTQARAVRDRLASELGRTFTIAGEETRAFPAPSQLLEAVALPGLDETRATRMRAVAAAALEGTLAPARLTALEPGEALAELERLPGIGPTYAMITLLRATGVTDALTLREPRLGSYIAHFYDTGNTPASAEQVEEIAEQWRPFRTWCCVLVRVAGDRLGLPYEEPPSRRAAHPARPRTS